MADEKVVPIALVHRTGLLLDPKDPRKTARAWLHHAGLEGRLWYIDGQFFLWESPAYRVLPVAELRALLGNFLDGCLKNTAKGEDAFRPTAYDVNQTVDALQQLGYRAILSPAWLELNSLNLFECVLCANGLLHLPTGILHPPTPTLYSVNALTFPYTIDASEPTQWLAFLDQLWPGEDEPIALLQEWFGYCLTPDTRYQKILVMIGPPRSGKGTIARILQRLLGMPNVCAPTLTAMASHFGRAVLIGKTAAIFSDAKISGRMDTAAITEALLSIRGEDTQTIPRKNLIDWTGPIRTRFTLLTNEMPRMDDASGALVSRMLLLPLTESFLGREDLALTERLVAELPGILQWARAGWLRLHARGHFPSVTISEDLRQEIQELTSPLHAFLAECCDISDPAASTPRPELYAAFTRWCKDRGRDHPGTEEQFGQRLTAAVPTLRSTRPRVNNPSRHRLYTGITLNPGRWSTL